MELTVDRITADSVGEPGHRTFYIQARRGDDLVSVIVEKEQVQLLAASILEVLARVEVEVGEAPDEDVMGLEEPIEPLWRAGRISIGYEQERDLLLLELEELLPGEEDDDDDDEEAVEADDDATPIPTEPVEPEREADKLRLWATREQMLAVSRHGALVCERGRPACQFCGSPLDPEGHACSAMNGHKG